MRLSKKKDFVLFFVLFLVLMVFAGCTSEKATTDKREELDKEQYLNLSLGNDPATLDPSLRSDTYSSSIMLNTMECLVRLEERNGVHYLNRGDAKEWSSNEDGTVWTFIIEGNKWEDGKPVTAHDYEFSVKRTADPKTGSPVSDFLAPLLNFEAISTGQMDPDKLGIRAVNDKTLEITLTNPLPAFLNTIGFTGFYPQRKDKVEEWGDRYGTAAEYVISNGPFRLESWARNSSLVLRKNDHYFDKDKVKLDKITFLIMTDENTRYNAYESGEIDLIAVDKQEWVDRFAQRDDSVHITFVTANNTCIFYNLKDDIFQNTNIRTAFSLAVDLEDMNEMCYSGLRVPTYGWVVPTISVGEYNFREEAGDITKDYLAELAAKGITPKDLLLKGMKELGLGSNPATLKISFALGGTDDFIRTVGEYLQQVYKEELGVDVELDFADWGIFLSRVFAGEYQFANISYGAYYNDPYDVLSMWMSKYDTLATGWVNKAYDDAIEAASIEMNDKKRMDLYKKAEYLLIKDDAVITPLVTATSNQFVRDYLNSYPTIAFSNMAYKYTHTTGR